MTDENENGEDTVIPSDNQSNGNGSSTNLDENIAALLCYLATLVTGIIFLILEKKSNFVRFHAMQSTIFFGAIMVLNVVVNYVPFIGGLLGMLLSLLGFIMWIVFMVKAYHKEYFKFPVIGQIAEDFVYKK